MKSALFTLLLSFMVATLIHAQEKKPLSPPMQTAGTVGSTDVRIDYNAPSKRGRLIWGDLVPYGRVWRTGANSATKITLASDLQVNGETLKAGSYALFTIPDENVWTVIFNTEANQWGAYNYDESKDVLRVEVQPTSADEAVEMMAFNIEDNQIRFAWDQLRFALSLSDGN